MRRILITSFSALALSLSAEVVNLQNGSLRATVDTAARKVTLFSKTDGKQFADFQLPRGTIETTKDQLSVIATDHRLTLKADDDFPFLLLTLSPVTTGPKEIKTLHLPDLVINCPVPLQQMKTLGTAGLKGVTDHSGSYMFLALAEPISRKGVVAAWVTSKKASGIVFSGKGPAANQAIIKAEAQYGRYLLPEKLAKDEGEIFAIGAFQDCRIGLEKYADLIADTFDIKMKPQIAGYCTWYSDKFGGAGSEESTKAFADKAEKLLMPYGFSYFQIDDRWQSGHSGHGKNGPDKNFTAHNPKGPYPSGMKPTADYLSAKGIRPGIWFMPFSGNSCDSFYADKRDWFVKSAIDYPPAGQKNTRRFNNINQKKGAPYETFWGGTSLDMTNPEFAKFMFEEVDRISNKWGYKYFKYDGMWTGMACEQLYVNDAYRPDDLGLQIFHDPHVTNVEAFRKGLRRVRDAAGDDVFILGCNVSQNMRTMGAAYGMVNAMRIGPDNGASWKRLCDGPIRGSARYFYNGRVWYNDPDPVYVRNKIPLTHARVISSWVAISGQLYAFSDWLPNLSEERVKVLQKTIAPCNDVDSRRPEDIFESPVARLWQVKKDDCHIFGFFNWKEKEGDTIGTTFERLGLDPSATYVAYDFWNEKFIPSIQKELKMDLPQSSCLVLSLRKMGNHPVVINTSRHVLSPIFDVDDEEWDADDKELEGESTVVGKDTYVLRVAVPAGMKLKKAEIEDADQISFTQKGMLAEISCVPQKCGDIDWELSFE